MSSLLKPTIIFFSACAYLILTLQAFSQDKPEYPKVSENLLQAEITTVDGNRFNLDDLKGKVILVNLWATWCGPCVAQLPYLVDLQKKHSFGTFEVIGLSVGDGGSNPEENRVIKLVGGRGNVNFTLATLSKEVQSGISSITKQSLVPQAVLIDREGFIRGIFVGGGTRVNETMRTIVEKVIKENQNTTQ